MLRISRKGDYGLLLLTWLAKRGKGKRVSLKEISVERKMPYKYISQIAPVLVEAGILGSKEGVGGGYYLKREPSKVSVGEVLEILEGPLAPVACMRDGCLCEPECMQKGIMEKMADAVYGTMHGYTIADLVTSK